MKTIRRKFDFVANNLENGKEKINWLEVNGHHKDKPAA